MSIDYTFSLAQLAQILSALENERRNPNTKRNAIRAIERNASQIGLSTEDVFDAADGLLSGRLSAAEFRAALRDDGCGPARFSTEATEPQPDEAHQLAEAYLMPDAGPLAMAESDAGGDDAATDIAEATEGAPVAATDAVVANPETSGTRVGLKEQLLAACQAAKHWLQAELDSPGETRPNDILHVLRAAIARAEGQSRPLRQAHEPHRQRPPREGSKESQVIAMLRRPEGATLAQIGESTGWQTHYADGRIMPTCVGNPACGAEIVAMGAA